MSIFAFGRALIPDSLAIRLGSYRKLDARSFDHRRGKWNYLDGLREFAHYRIIVGYYTRLRPYGSVLDIGCGSGLMQRMLVPYDYDRYLGIDISPEAIDRARLSLRAAPSSSQTMFQVGDLEQPLEWSGAPFDVIIINEALYYLEQPARVLARLAEQALAADGVVIISMHRSLNTRRLWRLLARHGWTPDDATMVRNKTGATWDIGVFAAGRLKRP
jgi:SAM-dependent methyltransferase